MADRMAVARAVLALAFNPDQPRDANGRWASGGESEEEAKEHRRARARAKAAVERLRKQGGFTLTNELTDSDLAGGYMVGLEGKPARVVSFDRFGVRHVLAYHNETVELRAGDDSLFLGGWLNQRNNKVYLDLAKHVGSKREAIALGLQNHQRAIWDVKAGKEIDLVGLSVKKKDQLTYEEEVERMRTMYSNQIHGMPRVRVPLDAETKKSGPTASQVHVDTPLTGQSGARPRRRRRRAAAIARAAAKR